MNVFKRIFGRKNVGEVKEEDNDKNVIEGETDISESDINVEKKSEKSNPKIEEIDLKYVTDDIEEGEEIRKLHAELMRELNKDNKNSEVDLVIHRIQELRRIIADTRKEGKVNPNYYKILEESIQEAKSIAKKYEDIKPIQSEFLTLLSKNHIYNEMDTVIEIINNERFKESEKLNLLALKILLNDKRKKYFKNMEDICTREYFKNSNNIQEKWIEILGEYRPEGWIEKIDEIASRDVFENISFIKNQYAIQLEKYGTKESLEKALSIYESEIASKIQNVPNKIERIKKTLGKIEENPNYKKIDEKAKINYINTIKTEMYYDKINSKRIEEIKKNDMELDDWRKGIILLAIYDKKQNVKTFQTLIKEMKKSFKYDVEKMKYLNQLYNKKSNIFDWKIFDSILSWKVDEKLLKEEKNNAIENSNSEKKEKVIESTKNEDSKKIVEIVKKEKKEEMNKDIEGSEKMKEKNQKNVIVSIPNNNSKVKKSSKNKKKEEKNNFVTIGSDFIEEISKLKAKMSMNSDMKMLDKIEIIEEKDSTDMRSRLELVLLLKKFGMEDVVEKRLSMENEIYNNINKFYKLKNQKSDLSVKKIKEGILKTVGADYKESTEKLLDEIEER